MIEPNVVLRQLERILADELFKKSKRYSDLLRFIVEHSLNGQLDDLRERTIGYKVFGRNRYYDVSTDPTVRVVATEVRKRLTLFYNSNGRDSEIWIDIPAGAYVAEFRTCHLLPSTPAPESALSVESLHKETASAPANLTSTPARSVTRPLRSFRWRFLLLPIAGLMLAALLWMLLSWTLLRPKVIDKFWGGTRGHSVVISIGLPPLDLPNPDQPPKSPNSVDNPSDQAESGLLGFKGCCDNVSMLDVSVGQAFATFLRKRGVDSIIRPANGTQFADFASGPVILIGLHNEWLLRFGAGLPFRFRQDALGGLQWIEEASQPAVRRWSRNPVLPTEKVDWDYAIISRIQEPSSGNWWVSAAGLTGAGTVRAQEFLVDEKLMETLAPMLTAHWEKKNLQIVLAIKVVKGSPGSAQVLTVRSW